MKLRSKTNDGWYFKKKDPKQPANGGLKNETLLPQGTALVLTTFCVKHLQMDQITSTWENS